MNINFDVDLYGGFADYSVNVSQLNAEDFEKLRWFLQELSGNRLAAETLEVDKKLIDFCKNKGQAK